jgi:hypothetical protein
VKEESQNQEKERGFALVGLWSSKGFCLTILKRSVVSFRRKFLA